MTARDLNSRIRRVQLVALDVDGVLTNGTIIMLPSGEEIKVFDVQDGTGVTYLERAGIRTALLTGRQSTANQKRAEELGIRYVFQGFKVKLDGLLQLVAQSGVAAKDMCYMGDDLPDIPVMREVGLAVAVPNARAEVRQVAHWTTRAPGGRGAVRELVEKILTVQGKWADIVERYGLPAWARRKR